MSHRVSIARYRRKRDPAKACTFMHRNQEMQTQHQGCVPPALSTALKAIKKRLGLSYDDLYSRSDRAMSKSHMENLIRYGDDSVPTQARASYVQSLERLLDALEQEENGVAPTVPAPTPQPLDFAEIKKQIAVMYRVRPEQVTIGIEF